MPKKLTREEFIKKAKEVHRERYDYSMVEYVNAITKIKINCKKHGIFEQTPNSHTSAAQNCPICMGNKRYTTKTFIEKAKKIHGNKYDYSLVEYKNISSKIKIICPMHGVFEKIADNHLRKQGCPFCSEHKISKKNFIEKAKKIHVDKYNYSLMVYENYNTKVKIKCSVHGIIFETTPANHLLSNGCEKCILSKKQDSFIKKAKIKHKNKYDYSLIKYKKHNSKVKIICPFHGEFEQTPTKHLKCGCLKCGINNKRYILSDFIKKVNKIHNNKYEYSLVKYKNSYTKIKIICKKHGVFEQLPTHHLSGSNCPECSNVKRHTTKSFTKKANITHKNRYDYSLVEYKNNKNKIKIICKKHGVFEQSPNHHIKGIGCPICGRLKAAKNKTKTSNIFIEEAKEIHGDEYDYSLVKYTFAKDNVKIICKKHGIFEQKAISHLRGGGCPKCSNINVNWADCGTTSKHFDSFKVYIVYMYNSEENFIKIGKTYNDIKIRMRRIKEYDYKILYFEENKKPSYINELESYLHKKFIKDKYKPLLEFGGKTECFKNLSINKIKKEIKLFKTNKTN